MAGSKSELYIEKSSVELINYRLQEKGRVRLRFNVVLLVLPGVALADVHLHMIRPAVSITAVAAVESRELNIFQ